MQNLNDVHFGSTIKSIIERSGDTKIEAANRLGWSKNNLFSIFRKKDVSTEVLKKITSVYRVPAEINLGEKRREELPRKEALPAELEVCKAELEGVRNENEALKGQILTLREMIDLLKTIK